MNDFDYYYGGAAVLVLCRRCSALVPNLQPSMCQHLEWHAQLDDEIAAAQASGTRPTHHAPRRESVSFQPGGLE